MCKVKNSLIASIVFLFLMGSSGSIYSQGEGGRRLTTPIGDIAFEVVGQVTNPSSTTSKQYGYLTLINGLSADQIFTSADPTMQNEATALFTFFTDAITERVIANGRLRIINRTGTTTIYFDSTPDGTFANRDSFSDGVPVLTFNYRQQVILDTGDTEGGTFGGTFTVVNLNTVTEVQPFEIGGERLRLGKKRDQFRVFYSGAPPSAAPPPQGVFAGFAVAIEPANPEPE
jgi:hypothetical protein